MKQQDKRPEPEPLWLNVFLHDSVIAKAMAFRFYHGAKADPNLSPSHTVIIGCKTEDGIWRSRSSAANCLASALTSNATIMWIKLRPCKDDAGYNLEQERIERIAEHLAIPYSVAKVKVRRGRQGFSKTYKFKAGLVVEIQHVCRMIMTYRPEALEERRSKVYNRDDGRYE